MAKIERRGVVNDIFFKLFCIFFTMLFLEDRVQKFT